jgi:hypothetical protein
MLCEIGFHPIKDNFCYGYYGPFRVIIDKQDGFVNATKLCNEGGKNYYDWIRNKTAKELILALERSKFADSIADYSPSTSQVVANDVSRWVSRRVQTENISEADRLISGTYCNPLLIPHIACWVSPSFALMVSEIVNYFFIEEMRAKVRVSEEAANQLLFDLQQSTLQLEDAKEIASTTQMALVSSIEDNGLLLNSMSVKQEVVDKLEEDVCEKICERQVWASTHAFTVLKLNADNSRRPYYVIRCQRRRLSGSIKKMRQKFPASEVIYQQRKVPNAINLYCRLKQQKIVEHSRNFCTPTCTEAQLLYHLNTLCGTEYPTSNILPLNTCVDIDNQ